MNHRRWLFLLMLVCAFAGYRSLQAARDQQQPAATPPAKIDLNSASERELLRLPDITFPLVRKIIASRPFKDTHELVSKKIVSEATYSRMRDLITVKESAPRRFGLRMPRLETVEALRSDH
jgi:DNA uptake protein ComE-like DNA-binding protein